MNKIHFRSSRWHLGFSFVEMTVALGIGALMLLGILALRKPIEIQYVADFPSIVRQQENAILGYIQANAGGLPNLANLPNSIIVDASTKIQLDVDPRLQALTAKYDPGNVLSEIINKAPSFGLPAISKIHPSRIDFCQQLYQIWRATPGGTSPAAITTTISKGENKAISIISVSEIISQLNCPYLMTSLAGQIKTYLWSKEIIELYTENVNFFDKELNDFFPITEKAVDLQVVSNAGVLATVILQHVLIDVALLTPVASIPYWGTMISANIGMVLLEVLFGARLHGSRLIKSRLPAAKAKYEAAYTAAQQGLLKAKAAQKEPVSAVHALVSSVL